MKKIIGLVFIFAIGVMLVGCGNKEKVNDWVIDLTNNKQELSTEVRQIFENARSEYGHNLEYVALLSKQVVAGTNYMFLCKGDNSYKIVIVYHDLENKSKITEVNDFNPIEYVNKNIEAQNEQLSGGWYVEIPENKMSLSNDVQKYFDASVETLTGAAYYPIAVLAHQDNSYAILCYGEGSYQGSVAGIYLITLNAEKTDKPEIASIANIDLKNYNK